MCRFLAAYPLLHGISATEGGEIPHPRLRWQVSYSLTTVVADVPRWKAMVQMSSLFAGRIATFIAAGQNKKIDELTCD